MPNTSLQTLVDLYQTPKKELSAVVKHLSQDEVPSLLALANTHKLFPEIFERLQPFFKMTEEDQENYKIRIKQREAALELLDALQESVKGTMFLVLKGLAFQSYYPSQLKRQLGDLDLTSAKLEDFGKVGQILGDKGLQMFSTMNLFVENGRHYGVASFEGKPFDKIKNVELQVGGFLMDYNKQIRTYIPWEVLEKRSTMCEIEGIRFPVPGIEGSLILYLAELITRREILLRDLFDLNFLCGNYQFDFDYVAKQVKRYHLQRALDLIQKSYADITGLEMPHQIQTLIEMVGVPGKFVFRGHLLGHVWPFLQTNCSRPFLKLLIAFLRQWTDQQNDNDKLLALLKRSDICFGPMPFYQNGSHIYLSKLNNDHHSSWQFRQLGHYHVLLSPLGCFLASAHALYSDEEFDMIVELLKKSK